MACPVLGRGMSGRSGRRSLCIDQGIETKQGIGGAANRSAERPFFRDERTVVAQSFRFIRAGPRDHVYDHLWLHIGVCPKSRP